VTERCENYTREEKKEATSWLYIEAKQKLKVFVQDRMQVLWVPFWLKKPTHLQDESFSFDFAWVCGLPCFQPKLLPCNSPP